MRNEKSEVRSQDPEEIAAENTEIIEKRDLAPGEKLESVDVKEINPDLEETEIDASQLLKEKNVIFIGDGEPPLAMHGAFRCELPDADTQRKGFYHEDARRIIQHFPKKYKRFQKLGDV